VTGVFALIAAGFALGLVFLPLQRRLWPSRDYPAASKAGRDLGGALGSLLVLATALYVLKRVFGPDDARPPLFANAAAALCAGLFMSGGDGARRSAIACLKGVASYALALPAVAAINAVNTLLVPSSENATSETLARLAKGPLDVSFFVAAAAVVVAVPLFEERFARGLLQPGFEAALSDRFGLRRARAASVLLASAAFTALHPPEAYLPVFSISLALGFVAARSGGVAGAIGFHAAHNAFAILYERDLRALLDSTGIFLGAIR
jgi:membrane protease YdiL (CAAX protease family)